LTSFPTLDDLFARAKPGDIVLNLTNPSAHYDVSAAALQAGFNVYSEKPLAMTMPQAVALKEEADGHGLTITSAPCSGLSQAAQTLWAAVRHGKVGTPRLVYAEMDDGYIPQAPYRKWFSETGAPWPHKDEFTVGCTIEHAGYYLSWLLQMFGPVRSVTAASAKIAAVEPEFDDRAADLSIGVLFFDSGVIARLTCSIVAPHDHAIKIVGDKGVLLLDECWDNLAPVKFRKRMVIRRRLLESPWRQTVKLAGTSTNPIQKRKGAATMNFALGPMDMLTCLDTAQPLHMSTDMSLHMNEITLALQNAGEHSGSQKMTTTFAPVAPMPWAGEIRK
jgi:predicted dehydrogenase